MAALTVVHVPQAPPQQPVKLALFRNLEGTDALIERLTGGKFEFSLIDARTVLSTTHLLAAVFRALNDQSNGRMKTRNIHSEVVLALNINNNIIEAYRRFGIQPSTTSLIVVKVGSNDDEQIGAELGEAIRGEQIEATDENLARYSDLEMIRKLYKLGNTAGAAAGKNRAEHGTAPSEREDMEAGVIESIALRGAA